MNIMKRHGTGDIWTDAKLLHAEERMAEARAFTARRALLRNSRPPSRRVRVWLGSILLAAGHRLLGSLPRSVGSPESPSESERLAGPSAPPLCGEVPPRL